MEELHAARIRFLLLLDWIVWDRQIQADIERLGEAEFLRRLSGGD